MKEITLQALWAFKLLPFHLLKGTNNENLQIIDVGEWNYHSGPDFFNASIVLNGQKVIGNVEFHIKSSDWYAHNHHHDSAYDSVCLHVVYEHDREVSTPHGILPTVELRSFISPMMIQQVNQLLLTENKPLCSYDNNAVGSIHFWKQVELAFFERIEHKSRLLSERFDQLKQVQTLVNPIHQVLFESIAQSFGNKVNNLPFQWLAQQVPIEKLMRLTTFQKKAILVGASGLVLDVKQHDDTKRLRQEWDFQRQKLQLHTLDRKVWKRKGLRPASFPLPRIQQLAHFVDQFSWNMELWERPVNEIKIELILALTSKIPNSDEPPISVAMAQLILVNSVVPFLWWYGELVQAPVIQEKAIQLSELLAPEENQIISFWKKWNIKPKTALDTQGLIELYNNWCKKKQCMKCLVGKQVLSPNKAGE